MSKVFGALASKPDIRNYRLNMRKPVDLPKTFVLPMPPVKNQGTVSSCVAHALAVLIEYFLDTQFDTEVQMSVGYIYGNKLNEGKGMVTRQAISQICAEGDVYYHDFPYNEEIPRIRTLLEQKKKELAACAKPLVSTAYFSLKGEKEIKTALLENGPVVIAVDWQKDMRVRDGAISSQFKEKTGGHCMILYGWNEKGWLIQNSWGTDWGDKGRATWPYEYKIREAYSVIVNEELELRKPFQTKTKIGKFFVRAINFVYTTIYGWRYKIKFVE